MNFYCVFKPLNEGFKEGRETIKGNARLELPCTSKIGAVIKKWPVIKLAS